MGLYEHGKIHSKYWQNIEVNDRDNVDDVTFRITAIHLLETWRIFILFLASSLKPHGPEKFG